MTLYRWPSGRASSGHDKSPAMYPHSRFYRELISGLHLFEPGQRNVPVLSQMMRLWFFHCMVSMTLKGDLHSKGFSNGMIRYGSVKIVNWVIRGLKKFDKKIPGIRLFLGKDRV
jgi:hypothetical protein